MLRRETTVALDAVQEAVEQKIGLTIAEGKADRRK